MKVQKKKRKQRTFKLYLAHLFSAKYIDIVILKVL